MGGKEQQHGGYEPGFDIRLDFLYEYVLRSLKIKIDKWQKMLNVEEYRSVVHEFFDIPDKSTVVLSLNALGQLTALDGYQTAMKMKSCYFIKKVTMSFGKDDHTFREHLIYGDLAPQPLEALITFIEEVVGPIITAEVSQQKWPEGVIADVKHHTETICGAIYTIQGQLRKKTLLHMPLEEDMIDLNKKMVTEKGPPGMDPQFKKKLESLVVKWNKQISEVIQQDSSQALSVTISTGSHPTPFIELQFWEDRVEDLQCIYDQLSNQKMQKCGALLEDIDSVYWPSFRATYRNVVSGLAESQDILAHLKPLRKYIEIVQNSTFDEVKEHLDPVVQCVCLIWGYSKHYCNPQRVIVLLQEICNLVIEMARAYLGASSIFQMEPEEGLMKSVTVLDVLDYFRDLYLEEKFRLETYFPEGTPVKHWDFLPHLVFQRFNKFEERLKELKELFETSVELCKLERIDFGGDGGKHFSTKVQHLHEEFTEFFQRFGGISYDCSDPEDESFEEDYSLFQEKVEDIDQQLSAICAHAFDACHTPESLYKLIITLGQLIERPIIKSDFQPKYPRYLQILNQDLERIQDILERSVMCCSVRDRKYAIYQQMPPYSASIHWARDMQQEIDGNMEKFQSLGLTFDEDNFQENVNKTLERHKNLSKKLKEFQNTTFQEWKSEVESQGEGWLNEFLFTDNASGVNDLGDSLIVVNFRPELYGSLKEIRYLKVAGFVEIPKLAEMLEKQFLTFRQYMIRLDNIVQSYNEILNIASDVELTLLRARIDEIDLMILEGRESLKWKDEGVSGYIDKLQSPVESLLGKVRQAVDNVDMISKLMLTWVERPLFERKEKRRDKLLSLDEVAMQRKLKQFKEIEESSGRIQEIMGRNKELLVEEDTVEESWRGYLKHVEGIIVHGLIRTVAVSFGYLLDHTDPTLTPSPFFEVTMELDLSCGPVFLPPLDSALEGNFMEMVEGIMSDICEQGALVQKVCVEESSGESENFLDELESMGDIVDMKEDIKDRIQAVVTMSFEYSTRFEPFAYLWEDDKKEYLSQFLQYGHQLSPEELDGLQAGESIPEAPPTLDQFKQVIDKFEGIYAEISKFVKDIIFEKWFRLDMDPFREALLQLCSSWGLLFKQYLIDSVIGGLSGLDHFIIEASAGLTQLLSEGDLKALISVMSWLQQVKERQQTTDNMFEPIKQYIELLKLYDYELPETVFVQLEELPQKWLETKKLGIQVKHQVAPMQAQEVSSIRKRIAEFDVKQHAYRDRFRTFPFFDPNIPFPYKEVDNIHFETATLEKEYQDICSAASLFEVHVPEPKALRQCRKEIRLAKQIWDYILIVEAFIDDWKTTPWQNINVENMDLECKRMSKEVKAMDKDVKDWTIYLGLEATIRNMVSSLKSVAELQNPSIRERHWEELMASTNIWPRLFKMLIHKFSADPKTTLADLLALNLHNFEEEVKNVVDKAVKESSMEKTLKELDDTWSTQEYNLELHPRTKIQLIRASEELIEILEDNQVQLQNIAMSKYIAFFQDEVEYWQNRLFICDQVLSALSEVQRTWCHLESIFIASDDIRANLPEDSARFDKIDTDFKLVLEKLYKWKNVVETTNQPDVLQELERLQKELAVCEKALADYLETKRLAFPRFYFVSSADLLDILSNGNEPEMVCRHLAKLFDAMSKLEFDKEDPSRQKVALAMKAKDGEVVLFNESCDCTGAVELWLARLERIMRQTIRNYFAVSVNDYEDKARELWIQEFPAQTALCGTQIWWTAEVNQSFTKLEEGYENALKDYHRKQVSQLNTLIGLLLGSLNAQERQKVMTICTIDVHSRDVVGKLIQMRVESAQAFQWQSQLRHRWDNKEGDCYANICDAELKYWYEYLGNTPRLVITPLTDRCYITLTQSLHLVMGGAPQGPAGTGKTETTKDLGRALGMMVYVFNCSEQMDYRSIGNIYKGLAQTGAWGCFDEFNRITVEVLSVVAVQVKSIQDAIRDKKTRFNFMGEDIALNFTVGLFITMNPGYAGRSELPENLKALFRPCAMVVPDFELICEIMLVAEGFQEAKILARKFITLYTLCKELLSKQDHYDWGLRAIKSVLVVAGSLKRGDPGRPEDQVLMRALRDFNIPKIVTDDMPVFMGLIGDLFPALEVPRKRDADFEASVRQATSQLKLQPEENFILKVVQLQELIDVRHSVFIAGNAGTGKTQVWKTLFKTHQTLKHKPLCNDLNPKAVTNDELFGVINPATREWKDGILSVLMRDQANMSGDGPKWIILDGDIDPMWIESLNTVMDDNKVLTLASNERIALTKMMRLIFEIYTLKTATPATVSRAGILYINPQDLGWNPFVASWLESRESPGEKANLTLLFDKYVPTCCDAFRSRFKRITPIPEITHIQLLCHLLECLLTPETLPPDCPKEWYELYFVFGVVWAFGSACFQDQMVDHRQDFSKWFQQEFKFIKFPQGGSVFDYFIDSESKRLVPWMEKVPKFELDPDIPLQATIVHTSETIRIKFFADMLMDQGHPVMLVGTAGSGKTVLVGDKLACLSESYIICKIPFNFYTTSEMLQRAMEKPLEKKAGRNFGPPGNKKLVYFIDDMNMPEVDAYGTVQPHTLIRQHVDYGHWYDRLKITLKDIHNVQYVACMNPTAGSFTINPRLQRHFAVFSVGFPGGEALQTIYKAILYQHLTSSVHKFSNTIQNTCQTVVNTALSLHMRVASTFLPTAVKFHYIFNLRDLSNIFQGLIFSTFDCLQQPIDLVRLWMHEASRVYGDKLVDDKDIQMFQKLLTDNVKKGFEDLDESILMAKPLIYCHFAQGIGDPKYMPVTNFNHLQRQLVDALKSYNEFNSIMNLVLFEDAINYICRISRILESPRGNALLVGVGGSGKQSLARLAAFLSGLEVFQITLRKGYGLIDLRSDLALLYIKAGQKNLGTTFLLTDAQVADEGFLVVINDMLASGEVADLLPDDEAENIIASMRTEVKAVGLPETRENCWKFFIDRVRKMLKCILCFSPVGTTLRNRSRKFPAVISCTSIIWFQGWPHEALMSVSQKFVKEIQVLPHELHDPIASFMAYVHSSVNDMSATYLANEKRYNYTTPKSFLEQIDLYGKLVTAKNLEALSKADRLESGLTKLESCADQVEELKKVLAVQEVVLKEKNEAADNLIKVVEKETRTVSVEKENAAVEERKVAVTAENVAKIQEVCRIELEKAEPALQAAYAALNTLNKANLTELKTFTSPPPDVISVISAVYLLWEGVKNGKIPKDKSWKSAKINMMGDAQKFLDGLLTLDKEAITPAVVDAMSPYVTSPGFDPEKIRSKSFAASGLCSYVLNVLTYNEVYQDVAPKRRALQEATDTLNKALDRLKFLKSRIDELEQKLAVLTSDYETAIEAKMKCQAEADKTALTIDLANRLVGGLGAEKTRWIQNVHNYRASTITIPGDMLLVTAFVSYVGCFTKKYRVELLENIWMPYLKKMDPKIPMSEDVDPLSILTDDAEIATWNNFGLPSDRMSSENASILMNSQRWPLIIDPQLQGNKWIRSMYGSNLKVIQLGQKGYLDVIEEAISAGSTVLIENLGENVDPVLEPLLARNLIKKGTAIKIGDREIDYNTNFRLILHSKLANPHYKPEMQAQSTLINFTVTRDGLEDQLLAEVVKMERPDLETQKSQLTKQQNEFKILLKKLEDDLLSRLQSAEGNFLDDTALVENLETTKRTAQEVEVKAKEAVITSAKIDTARELYRPAACRASLLYFILNDLNKINPIYQFSLKAFSTVFQNAIRTAAQAPEVAERIENLIDSITYSVWLYTTRGLFECDKLIFTTQMAFTIQVQKEIISPKDLDFLLRFPITPGVVSPVEFLTNISWGAIKSLAGLDEYRNIDRDIEGSSKRWKKFVEAECPEREKMPQDWKAKIGIHRLCIMRALRPDRMTYAVTVFVEETLGIKYVRSRRTDFAKSFEESNNTTPIFFILSPGVDPLKDVEALGKKMGYSTDIGNFHNISLGQGQEIVAENALETAAEKGHWVILQNIHLVSKWLSTLEKKLEQNWEHAHKKYRVFLSAEPASRPENHIIPQGILESSIKLTNEPPSGMMANIHKALDNFTQETLETCSKELEFKAILFSLCYFHAVVAERRKFGTQGWNRCYPFNTGDLTISVYVLLNYLEANNKVPWEDLRYLFGEIMYGGHITDDFDRRLCRAYLEEYLAPELLDGEIQYAPGFPAPSSTDLQGYHQYIDDTMPAESPILYGLHPNAEIGFLTATSENLFKTIFELQPRDSAGGGGQTSTKDEKIKQIIDDILEKLVDPFNMSDVQGRAEDKTPYVIVALQECERMNVLTTEIRKSLRELDLGLKGELTISSEMEELSNSLFLDQVPSSWTKRAYPSTLGLGSWYADLLLRARELETWSADFILPASVWLGGFFNPQSFLTAIMQMTARKQELPLDKMCLQCEVTKKTREEFTSPPRDGAYIHGLFMEGARWDMNLGTIIESKLKDLYPGMPVFYLKAITQDKQDTRSMYECPVYKTRMRDFTYVWTFNLRSRDKPSKWVLGGVALLLQV